MANDFNFEIEKIKKDIKKTHAKTVLLQLPDGLKPEAAKIADSLKESGAKIYIWLGSCFGACDIPDVKNVDLVVQFGHNRFR
jgi:2-(3-amino-3-carboxypropyl)histidine synthase